MPATEIVAEAEAIDEGTHIQAAYSEILDVEINLQLCVDSKDLYTLLSIQGNSIDKSITGGISSI